MKLLTLTALALLASAPAYAISDEIASANNGSVANTGTINGSTITTNSGAGAGAASASVKNTNTSSSSSSARQHQSQKQGQVQFSDSDASVKGSGNSANTVSVSHEAQKRNPVSTAYAAPLVAADDTCMGSSSAGGQGVGFGLSFGSTWTDENCVRRKDARELHSMGYKPAAIALLCQSEKVAKAMKAAGTPCVELAVGDSEVASAGESVVRAYPSQTTGGVGYIRH